VKKPLKSVTHGQRDARPTVTFPAAGHHRRLTGTTGGCCSVRGTSVRTICSDHDRRRGGGHSVKGGFKGRARGSCPPELGLNKFHERMSGASGIQDSGTHSQWTQESPVQRPDHDTTRTHHRCKKNFSYVFFKFSSRFLRFLTFFLFSKRFFYFKKRWQSSERQADLQEAFSK